MLEETHSSDRGPEPQDPWGEGAFWVLLLFTLAAATYLFLWKTLP